MVTGWFSLILIGCASMLGGLVDLLRNPANDVQAMARVWRPHQIKRGYIYRLISTGSIEGETLFLLHALFTLSEKIFQRQLTKQELSGLVDSKKGLLQVICHITRAGVLDKSTFSLKALKDLFSLDIRTKCGTHDLLGCRCHSEVIGVL